MHSSLQNSVMLNYFISVAADCAHTLSMGFCRFKVDSRLDRSGCIIMFSLFTMISSSPSPIAQL